MLEILLVLLYGLFMGLKRGMSSCLALCIPSIVPALLEQGGDWKNGVKVALWFNLPRIILLTLLGMVIGAGGFIIGSGLDSVGAGSDIWIAGYTIIGAMMFVYGVYVFTTADEKLERLKNREDVDTECNPKHPLVSRLRITMPRNRWGLMLWGGIVSISCIGETVLSLETIFVGLSTTAVSSPLQGAALGGLAFLLFSVGASIPSMALGGLGTGLADPEKKQKIMVQAEWLSGALMILFGIIFVGSFLFL